MIWFVAVVILGRLVHCWHIGAILVIAGAIIAGVGVGTIAGGTSAVVIVIVVAVLCGRAGRSVAVAVAVWWFRLAFSSLGGLGLVLHVACSRAPS